MAARCSAADTSRSPPRRDFAAMEADVEQGAVVKRTQLRDGATRRHPLGPQVLSGEAAQHVVDHARNAAAERPE